MVDIHHMLFGAPRRTPVQNLPKYEVQGDDGIFRRLERDGRKFRATMAPGCTGFWDSLREVREDHVVRRLPAKGA